jgi:RimJ/RimL family protein N-acetyltransferase
MAGDFPPEMQLREVTLAGGHVILEPLKLAHVNELWPDAVEPGLFQHLAPGMESSKADLAAWIGRRLEEKAAGVAMPYLQRDATTKKAFGCTAMFGISRRHHRIEIGHTWLAKSHRKTPANTEAKLLLLTEAFETMKAVRVQFKVDTRNEAGIRALERIGAVREGLMRSERILLDGWIRDAYVYSIIDPEWPDVKKRLNGFLFNRHGMEHLATRKPAPPLVPGLNPRVTPPPGVPVFAPYTPKSIPPKPIKPGQR